jgi:hypothetical protein
MTKATSTVTGLLLTCHPAVQRNVLVSLRLSSERQIAGAMVASGVRNHAIGNRHSRAWRTVMPDAM